MNDNVAVVSCIIGFFIIVLLIGGMILYEDLQESDEENCYKECYGLDLSGKESCLKNCMVYHAKCSDDSKQLEAIE